MDLGAAALPAMNNENCYKSYLLVRISLSRISLSVLVKSLKDMEERLLSKKPRLSLTVRINILFLAYFIH